MPSAERTSNNHRNFRHHGIRERIYHLRSRLDDATPLGIAAHHEPVHIVQKDERDQILIAVHDETRSLFRGLGVNNAPELDALVAFVIGLLRVKFLIRHDPYREASNARVAAKHGLAVFGLVFVKAAFVDNPRDDFLHVIRTRRRSIIGAIDFFGRHCRIHRLLAIPKRLAPITPLFNQRTNAAKARLVIGFAEIHRPADGRVHGGPTEFFRRNFLPDRCLYQRRSSQKQAAAIRHQHVIAHHRQISAPSHTHAHDGGDLRNTHGRHDSVVAKNTPKIVSIGKNIFLQRKKNASRIDEINGRNAILNGNILRPNYFFRRHRKKRASLYRGVVHDEHHHPGLDARQSRNHSRRRRATPFLIHFVRRVEAKFEERSGVGQQVYPLAGRQPRFRMLIFDRLRPPALADLFLFIANLGHQVGQRAHVRFKAQRAGINLGRENIIDRNRGRVGAFAHESRISEFVLKQLTISVRCQARSAGTYPRAWRSLKTTMPVTARLSAGAGHHSQLNFSELF